MKVLIIDNYDSFVYNLAQYMGELGARCVVVRNDAIDISNIIDSSYDAIVISPGPGTPEDKRYFGICTDVILQLGPTIPILGVCLGHQGIIHAFGGRVVNAKNVRHGKTSMVRYSCDVCDDSRNDGGKNDCDVGGDGDDGSGNDDDDVLCDNCNSAPDTTHHINSDTSSDTSSDTCDLFAGVSNPFIATRYHSLVGDDTLIPDVLNVIARAEDDGEIMAIQHKKYPIQGVQFHPESILTTHGKTILSNFLKSASLISDAKKHNNKKPKEETQ